MVEEWEQTSVNLKGRSRKETQPFEIYAPESIEQRSKCRWLYVVGYLGIFYFMIMAIIYILIEYALICKSQFKLQCNSATLMCEGKIDFINTNNSVFFELASACPPNDVEAPVRIYAIILSNSTKNFSVGVIEDEEANAYSYYRHLWGIYDENLIYSYNITFYFNKTIPDPFLRDLTVILRQNGTFDQDQTINQAIICLVFAGFVAFFNLSSKIMENDATTRLEQEIKQQQLHKIYIEPPEDIEQIDQNLENLREMALTWLLRSQKKSAEFSESDSEFSLFSSQ